MTPLFSPFNTNIINGNYSIRLRRIFGLCISSNPNSALDNYESYIGTSLIISTIRFLKTFTAEFGLNNDEHLGQHNP
ncbi:MAG: hypothetical protein LCH44_00120 [Bacteroidetes bacterium]|nr:hypothetical protein [Bacteroidota bacterium]